MSASLLTRSVQSLTILWSQISADGMDHKRMTRHCRRVPSAWKQIKVGIWMTKARKFHLGYKTTNYPLAKNTLISFQLSYNLVSFKPARFECRWYRVEVRLIMLLFRPQVISRGQGWSMSYEGERPSKFSCSFGIELRLCALGSNYLAATKRLILWFKCKLHLFSVIYIVLNQGSSSASVLRRPVEGLQLPAKYLLLFGNKTLSSLY